MSFGSRCLAVEILEVKWSRVWGGNKDDFGRCVAVDGGGNVYVTGVTGSLFSMGGRPFLVKFGPKGKMMWEKTWETESKYEQGFSVAVDVSDNVYVVGSTNPIGPDEWNALLVKCTPEGQILWRQVWGGSHGAGGNAVTVDARGNVYVVGSVVAHSSLDAFLVKYTAEGEMLWEKRWGRDETEWGRGVAVDVVGNVYIAGSTDVVLDSGGDAFLVKYSSQGNMLWERTWGRSFEDWGESVAVAPTGSVYVVGKTWLAAGNDYAFLVKYSSEGEILWEKTWGGGEHDEGESVAADAAGNVYIAGSTASFGAGSYDAFLVKYSPEGEILWEKTWGGSELEHRSSITVDTKGNVYTTGETHSYGARRGDAFLLCISSLLPSAVYLTKNASRLL